MKAQKLNRNELIIINVYGDTSRDRISFSDNIFNIPDFDGATDGNREGINIVILKEELNKWTKDAAKVGLTVEESALPVWDGHYGDSGWEGVEIIAHHENEDEVYVIWN